MVKIKYGRDDRILIRIRPKDWDSENNLPVGDAFSLNKQSCNLESLCQSSEDVLFDLGSPDKNCFRSSYGIAAVGAKSFQKQLYSQDNAPNEVWKPKLKHDPIECNYAHCEVWFIRAVLREGEKTTLEPKIPPSYKLKIREYYLKNLNLIRAPKL